MYNNLSFIITKHMLTLFKKLLIGMTYYKCLHCGWCEHKQSATTSHCTKSEQGMHRDVPLDFSYIYIKTET